MKVRATGTDGSTVAIDPNTLNAKPHYARFSCNDATGIVLTTPTTATVLAQATINVLGANFGITAVAGATGTMTIVRPGDYLVAFNASEVTPVNSQVLTLEVYGGAAGTTAQGVIVKTTSAGTAVMQPTLAATGILTLARGDILSLKAIGDTGNVTIKKYSFSVVQLTDSGNGA